MTPRWTRRSSCRPRTCRLSSPAEARYPEALASLRAAAAADSTDERARLAKVDALLSSDQFEAAHAA
jgi:hypothetical protein